MSGPIRKKLVLNNYADVPEINDQEKMIRPMVREKILHDRNTTTDHINEDELEFLDMMGDRVRKHKISVIANGAKRPANSSAPNSTVFKSRK